MQSIFRLLGALALTYVFIIMLMTAVAQQGVLQRMEREELQVGYGLAYGMMTDFEARQAALPQLRGEERELTARTNELEAELSAVQEAYNLAWESFFPFARRAARSGGCDVDLGSGPSIEDLRLRMAVWNAVQQCVNEKTLPESLLVQSGSMARGGGNVAQTFSDFGKVNTLYQQHKRKLESLQKRISVDSIATPEEVKARQSFGEALTLRRPWLFGGETLVSFPPSLLQILLALVSGAFGALLITLVIIVYPKNDLTLTNTSAYGARILLGGLIAVCVYIILLGGTAVLGAADGFDGAGANYMTFCAVAVLAGMFSDRVAHWLSEKANAFFKTTVPAPEHGATTR